MLKKKVKKNFEDNKRLYLVAGTLILTGVLIGIKFQKRVDAKDIKNKLKGVTMLKQSMNPMFPAAMSIPEIKEVLKHIEGAEFFDALVTNVNGAQSLIIR